MIEQSGWVQGPNATANGPLAEIMKRIAILQDEAGLIDLKALPPPQGGTANQSIPGVDQSGMPRAADY